MATLTLFDANQREIFGKIWRVDSNQGDLLFLLLNLDTGRIMYTGHQLCEIMLRCSVLLYDWKKNNSESELCQLLLKYYS